LEGMVKQVWGKWQELPASRKLIIVVMAAASLLALAFFVPWLTREEYTPLFTELDPKNASAVVEKLKENGIPYRLAAEGTSILVPKSQVYDIRIQLAGEGVLTDTGLGFELFDKSKLGVTDFERRLDYQRALQEELRRTIVQLEEIERARVHLVLPERSVFVSEDRPASAAVTIKLKPLASLKPAQIEGIIYLVSSSVENLPPENVKVIDSSGVVLSDGVVTGGDRSPAWQKMTQEEIRRSFERDLERRIQDMLERILGPNRAVAMVTAELDFDAVEESVVEYGEGSILSQQESQEESTGGGGAQGPAGIEGNIGLPYYPETGQAGETYSRTDIITNYLVDQIERRVIQAPGRLTRLSTAVVVDGLLSNEETERITQIVQTAIGFDALRGDQISVVSMPFDARPEAIPEEMDREPEEGRFPWSWLAASLIGLALLLIVLLLLFRRGKAPQQEEIPAVETPVPVRQIVPELTEEEKIHKERQKKITDIAREKPEEAVQLLRTWLSEE
jgi:flagellar M-ring protein FliF